MYKVFHLIVPSTGASSRGARGSDFHHAWDQHAQQLAELATASHGFRFYTRTPRTEAVHPAPDSSDSRFVYEGVDTFGFDTLRNATDFRDVARTFSPAQFDRSSAWVLAEEDLYTNGAPQGPLDTGPGIHIVTSMRRRPGMAVADFRRHQDDHAKLVVSTQGISRYAVNLLDDIDYESAAPPIDAVIEIWFRTLADMQACFTDPSMTGIQQRHNRVFVDTSTFYALHCRDGERWIAGARENTAVEAA